MKHEGRACAKLLYYVTLVFSLIYVIISPTPSYIYIIHILDIRYIIILQNLTMVNMGQSPNWSTSKSG